MAKKELGQQLLDLTTAFPLRLGQIADAGDQETLALWREFCAQALSFVTVGIYGKNLFEALARLWASTCVEAACFHRREDGELMVYAPKRGPNEVYQLQRHLPGVYHNSGEYWRGTILRVFEKEFTKGGERNMKLCRSLYVAQYSGPEERGWLTSRMYILDVEGQLPVEDCFPVRDIIANTTGELFIESHWKIFIPMTAARYEMADTTLSEEKRLAASERYSELYRKHSDGDGVDYYE